MEPSAASLLWSYLHILTKERYDALIAVYGTLEEAAKHIGEELLRGLKCREEGVRSALMRLESFEVARYAAQLKQRDIRFLEISDADYPAKLREIGDPPPFLYAKGDLAILDQPCIALVGTRKMSQYGRRVAGAFTPAFVAAGMVTVSGLADGIDAEVARQTIASGGKTVACLGHGLSMIYPEKNVTLAKEIVSKGGLLLTEFPLDYQPGTYTFPARNRVIAGLSLATVVLEAAEGSGALITADLALDYGRDVFAVPGQIFDPNYEGCHAFIAKGRAGLARKPEDVLVAIGIVAPSTTGDSSFVPGSPNEEKVYAVLTTMPQDADTLVERSSLQASHVATALTLLELAGGAKNTGGGQWVRAA